METIVNREIVLGYAARIPWDNYISSRSKGVGGNALFLDVADVRIIKRFAGEDQTALKELLLTDEDARLFPRALIKVLLNITDVRILQYALTLAYDFAEYDPSSRARFFVKPGAEAGGVHITPFLQLMGAAGSGARISSLDADPYVLEYATLMAALLLANEPVVTPATHAMLGFVTTQTRHKVGSLVPRQAKVTEVAVTALTMLLGNEAIRSLFIEQHGIDALVPCLSARNSQLLYEAAFCVWGLSLTPSQCPELERAGVTAAAARLVRETMPTKVIRMAVAILANIARNPDCGDLAVADISETHVPATVDALKGSGAAAGDVEMSEDLRFLADALRANKRRLSSMERYERELTSRRFDWTAVHTSDFWKENALAFEAGDFRLISALGELLDDPATDETTLAVALNDVGEFAVSHPSGRAVLGHLGLRPIVISFLRREEDALRQQALLACSKLMVVRWQYVGGNTTTGGGVAPKSADAAVVAGLASAGK